MCKTYNEYKSLALTYRSLKKQEKKLKNKLDALRSEAIQFMEEHNITFYNGGIFTISTHINHRETLDKPALIHDFGEDVINNYIKTTDYVTLTVR